MTQPKTLRIAVNPELCQGHNRCTRIAPGLFDTDQYGIAHVVGDGSVPAGMEDKARLAERNCPEFAITIQEA